MLVEDSEVGGLVNTWSFKPGWQQRAGMVAWGIAIGIFLCEWETSQFELFAACACALGAIVNPGGDPRPGIDR